MIAGKGEPDSGTNTGWNKQHNMILAAVHGSAVNHIQKNIEGEPWREHFQHI